MRSLAWLQVDLDCAATVANRRSASAFTGYGSGAENSAAPGKVNLEAAASA